MQIGSLPFSPTQRLSQPNLVPEIPFWFDNLWITTWYCMRTGIVGGIRYGDIVHHNNSTMTRIQVSQFLLTFHRKTAPITKPAAWQPK